MWGSSSSWMFRRLTHRHPPGTYFFHLLPSTTWNSFRVSPCFVFYTRTKIRLIEGNAKCRHLKNLPVKWLWGRCYSVWGPEPHSRPPTFLTHCIRVYKCTFSHWEEGRIEPESWLERHQFTKLDKKYQHDWLYLQSLNSDKHLPWSPFTGVNIFRWRNFVLVS